MFSPAAVNPAEVIEPALLRVAASHWYVLGQEVEAFEREFAAYVGMPHCVTVASGTDALELALRAAGVERGKGVVMAANAGFYGSAAAHAIGAQPLYVDVAQDTLTLCPSALEAALALSPAAVILTHLYGQMGEVERIAGLCAAAGVPLIEDCAQAHGAARRGRQAGAFGDFACFSFYPTKNLGAIGDGGAVLARNAAAANRLRQLRQYGWSEKYVVAMAGGCNSRLDELQAAVLRAKLPLLAAHNQRRRTIAQRYNEAFAGLPLILPSSLDSDYVAHLYVVRSGRRDALRAHLAGLGVASDIHYPLPDHRQPAYPGARCCGSLAVTEQACAEALSLPCHPGLGDDEQARVIADVCSFFADGTVACSA